MKSKHLIAAFSVCALLFTTVGISNANPFTHNRSYDGGGYDLSPEKRADLEEIYDTSSKKIQPLRDTLYAKRLELDALAQNPNTKPGTIKALTKEIAELRSEIRDILEASDTRVEKETGVRGSDRGYYRGYHNGRDGYGNRGGGGYGRHGGGHGGWCN